jgi:hypothetical protein
MHPQHDPALPGAATSGRASCSLDRPLRRQESRPNHAGRPNVIALRRKGSFLIGRDALVSPAITGKTTKRVRRMSRGLRALVLLVLVTGCGSREYDPPRNLDDACSIVSQRPHYLRAMEQTEGRWGVPVAVQMATIYHESRFIGNARTPRRYTLGVIPMGRQSSAYGYSQALDGTWEEYLAESRGWRRSRDDIDDATDFMGWYMDKTERSLGIPKTDARNQYLAYHEGRAGYARGSYKAKAWLLRVADQVQARAVMYDAQLATCRGRRA